MKDAPNNWLKLLFRWISGAATQKDENSLNLLAKDNPFLADALEGYRSVPEGKHLEAVTRLKVKLRNKSRNKEHRITFYLTRIAAFGLVLLGTWYLFQALGEDKKGSITFVQEEKRAENEPLHRPKTTLSADSVAIPGFREDDFAVSENRNREKSESSQLLDSRKTEVRTPSPVVAPHAAETNAAPTRAKKDYEAAEDRLAVEEQELAITTQEIDADKKMVAKPKGEIEITKAPEQGSPEADDLGFKLYDGERTAAGNAGIVQTITGQVVNGVGGPLPGAQVQILSTRQGVITDPQGLFKLASEVYQPTLKVQFDGYSEQQLVVKDNSFLNIQLADNTDGPTGIDILNATTNERKEYRDGAMFSPQGGYDAFEKYVKKELQKFSLKKGIRAKGRITVSFVLDKKGRPEDFKMLQSLGKEYDEETFRVFKEGPPWTGEPDVRKAYSVELD